MGVEGLRPAINPKDDSRQRSPGRPGPFRGQLPDIDVPQSCINLLT